MKTKSKRKHQEPTRASLREIPEIDFKKVAVRPNPYAARIAVEGIVLQVGRGRPKRVLEVGKTRPRSIRFPDDVWALLERRAKAKGISLHAALRQAIVRWAKTAA